MFRLIACVLCLVAVPAMAQPPQQDFRALIRAGDRAGVEAALTKAEAADADPSNPDRGDPWRLRELYSVFTDLDPATDAFTSSWLADAPEDPRADVARGWFLIRQGWAWRGTGYPSETFRDRLVHGNDLHHQAFSLMQQAMAARPDFLPASDGVLALATTAGDDSTVPVTLEQVMSLRPNRHSLMLAMEKLTPQWGGTQRQVDLICARYAPLIPLDPPYDAATCAIDAAYYAGYGEGPRANAARAALAGNSSPWLDDARYAELMNGSLPPYQTIAALQRIRAERPFDRNEAQLWDSVTTPPGELMQPTAFRQAIRDEVKTRTAAANNAPLDPDTISALWGVLQDDLWQNNTPYPAADMIARQRAVLAAFPENPKTWGQLADDILTYGTGPGQSDLDRMAEAEPYFENAIAYSLHAPLELRRAVKPKLRLLLGDDDLAKPAVDPATLPPRAEARIEEVLVCPALRQLILLETVCAATGEENCIPWQGDTTHLLEKLFARAGSCRGALANRSPDEIAYSPVPLN